jgi:hypothetical protein
MIVSVHQPQYLPWPGYWDKMARSDVFVILDNVQFKKNEWQNRNRIKSETGWQWLTVPVLHSFGQKINEVHVDHKRDWRRKHRNAIRLCYAKAHFFKEYEGILLGPLDEQWEKLAMLNTHYIRIIKNLLGIKTKLLLASELGKMPEEPTERLTAICRELGADTYLSGNGARGYLDVEKFDLEGMGVMFQDYAPPIYPQRFSDFVEGLSAIDIIFNCGEKSLKVIQNGNFPGPGHLLECSKEGWKE